MSAITLPSLSSRINGRYRTELGCIFSICLTFGFSPGAVLRRIFPIVRPEDVLEVRIHFFTKNPRRGKGPVGNSSLKQQALLVVGQHLKALELVPVDCALPAEKRSAIVEAVLLDVRALANAVRHGKHGGNFLAAFHRSYQHRAMKHSVLSQ